MEQFGYRFQIRFQKNVILTQEYHSLISGLNIFLCPLLLLLFIFCGWYELRFTQDLIIRVDIIE